MSKPQEFDRDFDLALVRGLHPRSLDPEALAPFDARTPRDSDMPIEIRAARIIAGLVERVEVFASRNIRTDTTSITFPIVRRAAGQELTRRVELELAADRASITRRVEVAHRENPKPPAPYKPGLYERLAMARGRGPR